MGELTQSSCNENPTSETSSCAPSIAFSEGITSSAINSGSALAGLISNSPSPSLAYASASSILENVVKRIFVFSFSQ